MSFAGVEVVECEKLRDWGRAEEWCKGEGEEEGEFVYFEAEVQWVQEEHEVYHPFEGKL